jgi:Ca-activated chloride channel family protein
LEQEVESALMFARPPLAFGWPVELQYVHAWQATLLFALLALPIVLLGIGSLKSMGRLRQWVAIGMRLLVLLVFVLVIAGARWVRQNKDAEVIALRDISLSTGEVRDFPGRTLTSSLDDYLRTVSNTQHKPADDRIGVISFGSNPLIDSIPNTTLLLDSRAIRDPGNGTDIAAAIQLALATLQRDTMHRLLLISDGNATTGDLDSALSAAAAQHVPIDVMPLNYDVQHEVLVDRLVAPAWKREDEPFTIEVYLTSTNKVPVSGKLTVLHSGQPMDMDPQIPGVQPERHITLQPGSNRELVQVPALTGSNLIHTFHAVFEADHMNPGPGSDTGNDTAAATADAPGDTLLDNNTADAFTFVRGKGRVLYVDCVADGRGNLLADALAGQGIHLDHIYGADNFPTNLVEFQNYDAVILANVARGAGGLSEDQQRMLATYVHDMGGGLVMIGGDNTFGAGGWQGSKLEEVLPVTMDIPAQRQLPKGALVLIIDAIEQEEGNYWAEQCALKAVDALSAHDDVAVISGSWSTGVNWDYPLAPKGDGEKVKSAIKAMNPTDFPSFDTMLQAALHGNNGVGGLIDSDAQQKHVILISDDDPEPAAQSTLDEFVRAKVSVSSVIDFPHGGVDLNSDMTRIAKETHGRVYGPIYSNIAQLPQIFIKEASIIRRNLIYKDRNGIPLHASASNSEVMKGLTSLPPLYGMILTGKKQNPQIELPIVAGKNNDPVLAHWQTGLGKALVWTSDAFNDWSAAWLASGEYDKFWAQVVRSVSRPPQSADFDVQTSREDGKGKITVEALSKDSTFLNFLSIGGQVIGPDMKPRSIHLVQTGPGTYTGEYNASDPGNYVAVMSYHGAANQAGVMLSGMAVNSSPELRDLRSDQATLQSIADRTGGRVLPAFDADQADLFTRDGLAPTSSPLPIWDLLVPLLLSLILMDVAVRRIAWDWVSIKKLAESAAGRVRSVTTTRNVETRQSLDALRRIREEVAATSIKSRDAIDRPAVAAVSRSIPRPDPRAKFEGKGVEGDIGSIVGGATDKPLPAAPRKIEPKGGANGSVDSMGGLMAAKRRAQQKIREKEKTE